MHVDDPKRELDRRLRERHREGFLRLFVLFVIGWWMLAVPIAAALALFTEMGLAIIQVVLFAPTPLCALVAGILFERARRYVRFADRHRPFATAIIPDGETLPGGEHGVVDATTQKRGSMVSALNESIRSMSWLRIVLWVLGIVLFGLFPFTVSWIRTRRAPRLRRRKRTPPPIPAQQKFKPQRGVWAESRYMLPADASPQPSQDPTAAE